MINGHDDDEADRITSRLATAEMQLAKARTRDASDDRYVEEIKHLTDIVNMQRDLLIEMRRVIAESELISPHLWSTVFSAADLLNIEIDFSTGSEGDLAALREKRAAITRRLAGEIVTLRARIASFAPESPSEQDEKRLPGEPGSRLRAVLNLQPALKS